MPIWGRLYFWASGRQHHSPPTQGSLLHPRGSPLARRKGFGGRGGWSTSGEAAATRTQVQPSVPAAPSPAFPLGAPPPRRSPSACWEGSFPCPPNSAPPPRAQAFLPMARKSVSHHNCVQMGLEVGERQRWECHQDPAPGSQAAAATWGEGGTMPYLC